jgi:tape measure domain-containing protein
VADTIIASLRANLRLDATGVEETITRFKELDKNVTAAREHINLGLKGAANIDTNFAAKGFATIGTGAKQAAADTISLIEKLKSVGAGTETIEAVSQKFASAIRTITAQSQVKLGSFGELKDITVNIQKAQAELNALILLLDKYDKRASVVQSGNLKTNIPSASATDPQAAQLRVIQQEQINLVRQAAREQEEAERKRQFSHSNNLARIAKEAELGRADVDQFVKNAYTKLAADSALSNSRLKNTTTVANLQMAADEAVHQAFLTASRAKQRVAEDEAIGSINQSTIAANAKTAGAEREAVLARNLFRQRADAASQAAATEASAVRATASATLIAADAIKPESIIKTTRAKLAKKTLDAEVSLKEAQQAADAQKHALDAVAGLQKEAAITGLTATKTLELAEASKKLAAASEASNKAQERLNAADARAILLESGLGDALNKSKQDFINNLKAVKDLETERIRLAAQNEKLRQQLSQPVSQDGVLAWLRNLGSAATLVSGPLSGLTSRLQALASLTNREDVFTALNFAGAAVGVTALTKFSNEAIRVAKNLEPVEQLLNLTRGANERTGKSFEDFTAVAIKYGLSLEHIAGPFARLKIATEGTILAGERFKALMADMASISATFALPQEQIAGMAKAIEQMLSKGTVQAEEFRQQLGDRLPAAARVGLLTFRELTGNATASMGDFLKAMEKRQISSAQFLDLFFTKFKEVYGIDSEKRIENVSAAQGRLSSAYDVAVRKIDIALGTTALYKTALGSLASVMEIVSKNASVTAALLGGANMLAGVLVFRKITTAIVAANAAAATTGATLGGLALVMGRLRTAGALAAGVFAVLSGVFAIKALTGFRSELSNTVTDVDNAKKKIKEGVDEKGFTLFKIDTDATSTVLSMKLTALS